MRVSKPIKIKQEWEKHIRENIVNTNAYTEAVIAFLNSQSDDFCKKNKKYTGFGMVVRMQTIGLVDGWNDLDMIDKYCK